MCGICWTGVHQNATGEPLAPRPAGQPLLPWSLVVGELLGDPSIGERAWNAYNQIEEEISELSRSKGDSGDPEIIRSSHADLNSMVRSAKARVLEGIPGIDQPGFTKIYAERVWPAEAFGKTRQYGRRR